MTSRGWKAISFASILIAAASIIVLVYSRRIDGFDTADVVSRIRPLNQLSTVRYSIQRVIGIKEAKQPFGEESILLMVQGAVLAGVNLADLRGEDVHVLNNHTVVIHLPAPQVLETFIDEKNTRVWDRQITWWTPWIGYDPDLEHKARLSALEEIKNAAISDGILASAQKNAEISIRSFLAAMQMDVTFGGT